MNWDINAPVTEDVNRAGHVVKAYESLSRRDLQFFYVFKPLSLS